MKIGRFYSDSVRVGQVELDEFESHHLVHVMRLDAGGEVELFDGEGAVGRGTVSAVWRNGATVAVKSVEQLQRRQSGRVIIAASVAKGQRFERLITMCSEFGVDHIAPILFDRTVKLAKGSGAAERYKRLGISAAKQCGSSFLPKISAPVKLADGIAELKAQYPEARIVFGGFGGEAEEILEVAKGSGDVVVFVGPEGGLTAEEEELLKANGASSVRLCETTLRVETAAVGFCAILCARSCRGGSGD